MAHNWKFKDGWMLLEPNLLTLCSSGWWIFKIMSSCTCLDATQLSSTSVHVCAWLCCTWRTWRIHIQALEVEVWGLRSGRSFVPDRCSTAHKRVHEFPPTGSERFVRMDFYRRCWYTPPPFPHTHFAVCTHTPLRCKRLCAGLLLNECRFYSSYFQAMRVL